MTKPQLNLANVAQLTETEIRHTFNTRMCEVQAFHVSPDGFSVRPDWFIPLAEMSSQLIQLANSVEATIGAIGAAKTNRGGLLIYPNDWVVVYENDVIEVLDDVSFRYRFQSPVDVHVERDFVYLINTMAANIHIWAKSKGFWPTEGRNDGEMIALMHTELSEAMEAIRDGNPPDKHVPSLSSVEVEFADTIIRMLDYCGAKRYHIGEAIVAKMRVNQNRPHKHGRKFSVLGTTKILLDDKTFKQIEHLYVGDRIIAFDNAAYDADPEMLLPYVTKNILRIVRGAAKSLLRVTVKGEWPLYITDEHPVYVMDRGWVEAKDLKAGDVLKRWGIIPTRTIDSITRLTPENKRVWTRLGGTAAGIPVYNLDVEDFGTFVANTYLLKGAEKEQKVVRNESKPQG